MTDDLPPGPAFIQWRAGMSELPWLVSDGEIARDRHSVPPGYVWQPATIGTAAGWVRGGVGLAGFAHDLAVRHSAGTLRRCCTTICGICTSGRRSG